MSLRVGPHVIAGYARTAAATAVVKAAPAAPVKAEVNPLEKAQSAFERVLPVLPVLRLNK